jgi:hypothetical protein
MSVFDLHSAVLAAHRGFVPSRCTIADPHAAALLGQARPGHLQRDAGRLGEWGCLPVGA